MYHALLSIIDRNDTIAKNTLFCLVYIDSKKSNHFCVKICKKRALEVGSNKKGNFTPLILFPSSFYHYCQKNTYNETGLLRTIKTCG